MKELSLEEAAVIAHMRLRNNDIEPRSGNRVSRYTVTGHIIVQGVCQGVPQGSLIGSSD